MSPTKHVLSLVKHHVCLVARFVLDGYRAYIVKRLGRWLLKWKLEDMDVTFTGDWVPG